MELKISAPFWAQMKTPLWTIQKTRRTWAKTLFFIPIRMKSLHSQISRERTVTCLSFTKFLNAVVAARSPIVTTRKEMSWTAWLQLSNWLIQIIPTFLLIKPMSMYKRFNLIIPIRTTLPISFPSLWSLYKRRTPVRVWELIPFLSFNRWLTLSKWLLFDGAEGNFVFLWEQLLWFHHERIYLFWQFWREGIQP